MSYDYTAALEVFSKSRKRAWELRELQLSSSSSPPPPQPRKQNGGDNNVDTVPAQLQRAVDTMAELSVSCPLTPLLWIQYAATLSEWYGTIHDLASTTATNNGSTENAKEEGVEEGGDLDSGNATEPQFSQKQQQRYELELQTLQLGLTEFPGSALLQVRAVVMQVHALLSAHGLVMGEETQVGAKDEDSTPITIPSDTLESILSIVQTALSTLHDGSAYRNEDYLVVILYRLWAAVAAVALQQLQRQPPMSQTSNESNKSTTGSHDYWTGSLTDCFLQRSRCPMREANQTLSTELSDVISFLESRSEATSQETSDWARNIQNTMRDDMEHGRRWEAQRYSRFVPYEDAIEGALLADGVLLTRTQTEFLHHRHSTASATSRPGRQRSVRDIFASCWDHVDWKTIVQSRNQTYSMGLGGNETVQAFVRYVRAVQQYHNSITKEQEQQEQRPVDATPDLNDDDDGDETSSTNLVLPLMLAIYERGVAECPCVEYLWLTYLRDMQQWSRRYPSILNGSDRGETGQALSWADRYRSVAARAVRNCPYSVPLLQQRIVAVLHCVNLPSTSASSSTLVVVDPDQLLEIAQKGIDLKFLPNQPRVVLDLYLTAICVVKRRILSLLAGGNHAPPLLETPTSNKSKAAAVPLYYDDGEAFPTSSKSKKNKSPAKNNSSKDTAAIHSAFAEDDDARQEVQDLMEDLNDMYDEVETRLRKATAGPPTSSSGTEDIALLWRERAQTETLLLKPLRLAMTALEESSSDESPKGIVDDAAITDDLVYFEKSIRAHNPPHPSLYASYIRHYMSLVAMPAAGDAPSSSPVQIMIRLRRIRGLFEKAIGSVGKGTMGAASSMQSTAATTSSPSLDYDSALFSLCNEWIEFEKIFGSERSSGKARKAIERKLQKTGHSIKKGLQPQNEADPNEQSEVELAAPIESTQDTTAVKRPLTDVDQSVPLAKKAKTTETDDIVHANDEAMDETSMEMEPMQLPGKSIVKEAAQAADAATMGKKQIPKVRIGKMEYPAHPLTVRVSNLSLDTEDMDLVDTFRPKCGPIVHAKIVREKPQQSHKHHHGGHSGKPPSMGWGLIQFERVESVDAALALHDTLGIHEQLVKVDRSHVPAVSIVPPGMHRVRPKGDGKVSKRNEKRRGRFNAITATADQDGSGGYTAAASPQMEASVELSNNQTVIATVPAVAETTASVAAHGHNDKEGERLKQETSAAIKPSSAPAAMPAAAACLAFRPRTVPRGGGGGHSDKKQHPKARLQLDK